jgi:Ca2+/Na+ antiporter
MNINEKFRGKEFWNTMNLVLFMVWYVFIFIFALALREYFLYFIIISAIFFLLYAYIKKSIVSKKQLEGAGKRVLYGWVDEEEDLGEEVEMIIKSINTFESLSEDENESVEKFIEEVKIGYEKQRSNIKEKEINDIINGVLKIEE